MSLADALALLRQHRPCVLINTGILEQLLAWERIHLGNRAL
jgi:hypothetical protein